MYINILVLWLCFHKDNTFFLVEIHGISQLTFSQNVSKGCWSLAKRTEYNFILSSFTIRYCHLPGQCLPGIPRRHLEKLSAGWYSQRNQFISKEDKSMFLFCSHTILNTVHLYLSYTTGNGGGSYSINNNWEGEFKNNTKVINSVIHIIYWMHLV